MNKTKKNKVVSNINPTFVVELTHVGFVIPLQYSAFCLWSEL